MANNYKYIDEWKKENYDRVTVMVNNKEEIEKRAEKLGMSRNQYVLYCVEKEINSDK